MTVTAMQMADMMGASVVAGVNVPPVKKSALVVRVYDGKVRARSSGAG
jgi:hypothetical protein